jgi:Sec-independent protein translocase protein TatA
MFSLGFYEWIIIVLSIIVFVKPNDYPSLARGIGKVFRKIELFWKNVGNSFDIYE